MCARFQLYNLLNHNDMKYLRKFETEDDVMVMVQPNVVLVEDNRSVMYNVDSSGVYIQHINGSIYKPQQWANEGFANDLVNGVAIITQEHSFVMAKDAYATTSVWSSDSNYVSGCSLTQDLETAKKLYTGAKDTDLIAAKYLSNSAAYKCSQFLFPNEQTGYLPSVGEWNIVKKYFEDVNNARIAIGLSPMEPGKYWTSTQYYAASAWLAGISETSIAFWEDESKSQYLNIWVFQSLTLSE